MEKFTFAAHKAYGEPLRLPPKPPSHDKPREKPKGADRAKTRTASRDPLGQGGALTGGGREDVVDAFSNDSSSSSSSSSKEQVKASARRATPVKPQPFKVDEAVLLGRRTSCRTTKRRAKSSTADADLPEDLSCDTQQTTIAEAGQVKPRMSTTDWTTGTTATVGVKEDSTTASRRSLQVMSAELARIYHSNRSHAQNSNCGKSRIVAGDNERGAEEKPRPALQLLGHAPKPPASSRNAGRRPAIKRRLTMCGSQIADFSQLEPTTVVPAGETLDIPCIYELSETHGSDLGIINRLTNVLTPPPPVVSPATVYSPESSNHFRPAAQLPRKERTPKRERPFVQLKSHRVSSPHASQAETVWRTDKPRESGLMTCRSLAVPLLIRGRCLNANALRPTLGANSNALPHPSDSRDQASGSSASKSRPSNSGQKETWEQKNSLARTDFHAGRFTRPSREKAEQSRRGGGRSSGVEDADKLPTKTEKDIMTETVRKHKQEAVERLKEVEILKQASAQLLASVSHPGQDSALAATLARDSALAATPAQDSVQIVTPSPDAGQNLLPPQDRTLAPSADGLTSAPFAAENVDNTALDQQIIQTKMKLAAFSMLQANVAARKVERKIGLKTVIQTLKLFKGKKALRSPTASRTVSGPDLWHPTPKRHSKISAVSSDHRKRRSTLQRPATEKLAGKWLKAARKVIGHKEVSPTSAAAGALIEVTEAEQALGLTEAEKDGEAEKEEKDGEDEKAKAKTEDHMEDNNSSSSSEEESMESDKSKEEKESEDMFASTSDNRLGSSQTREKSSQKSQKIKVRACMPALVHIVNEKNPLPTPQRNDSKCSKVSPLRVSWGKESALLVPPGAGSPQQLSSKPSQKGEGEVAPPVVALPENTAAVSETEMTVLPKIVPSLLKPSPPTEKPGEKPKKLWMRSLYHLSKGASYHQIQTQQQEEEDDEEEADKMWNSIAMGIKRSRKKRGSVASLQKPRASIVLRDSRKISTASLKSVTTTEGFKSISLFQPDRIPLPSEVLRKHSRLGLEELKESEELRRNEKKASSMKIFRCIKSIIQRQVRSAICRRWFKAMRLVCDVLYITKCMSRRSYEITMQHPTFLDVVDQASCLSAREAGDVFDPTAVKMTTRSNAFSLTPEEIIVLQLSPEQRSNRQVEALMKTLQRLDCFCSYPLKYQKEMARCATYNSLAPRRLIIREGHNPTFFYLIMSGQAVVTRLEETAPGGPMRRETLGMLTTGQAFGHHDFHPPDSLRKVTVMSRSVMQLLSLSRHLYDAIFNPPGLSASGRGSDFIQWLGKLVFLQGWPVEKLRQNPGLCSMRFYRPGMVVVPDSTDSDFVYVVHSGTCKVFMNFRCPAPTRQHLQEMVRKGLFQKKGKTKHMIDFELEKLLTKSHVGETIRRAKYGTHVGRRKFAVKGSISTRMERPREFMHYINTGALCFGPYEVSSSTQATLAATVTPQTPKHISAFSPALLARLRDLCKMARERCAKKRKSATRDSSSKIPDTEGVHPEGQCASTEPPQPEDVSDAGFVIPDSLAHFHGAVIPVTWEDFLERPDLLLKDNLDLNQLAMLALHSSKQQNTHFGVGPGATLHPPVKSTKHVTLSAAGGKETAAKEDSRMSGRGSSEEKSRNNLGDATDTKSVTPRRQSSHKRHSVTPRRQSSHKRHSVTPQRQSSHKRHSVSARSRSSSRKRKTVVTHDGSNDYFDNGLDSSRNYSSCSDEGTNDDFTSCGTDTDWERSDSPASLSSPLAQPSHSDSSTADADSVRRASSNNNALDYGTDDESKQNARCSAECSAEEEETGEGCRRGFGEDEVDPSVTSPKGARARGSLVDPQRVPGQESDLEAEMALRQLKMEAVDRMLAEREKEQKKKEEVDEEKTLDPSLGMPYRRHVRLHLAERSKSAKLRPSGNKGFRKWRAATASTASTWDRAALRQTGRHAESNDRKGPNAAEEGRTVQSSQADSGMVEARSSVCPTIATDCIPETDRTQPISCSECRSPDHGLFSADSLPEDTDEHCRSENRSSENSGRESDDDEVEISFRTASSKQSRRKTPRGSLVPLIGNKEHDGEENFRLSAEDRNHSSFSPWRCASTQEFSISNVSPNTQSSAPTGPVQNRDGGEEGGEILSPNHNRNALQKRYDQGRPQSLPSGGNAGPRPSGSRKMETQFEEEVLSDLELAEPGPRQLLHDTHSHLDSLTVLAKAGDKWARKEENLQMLDSLDDKEVEDIVEVKRVMMQEGKMMDFGAIVKKLMEMKNEAARSSQEEVPFQATLTEDKFPKRKTLASLRSLSPPSSVRSSTRRPSSSRKSGLSILPPIMAPVLRKSIMRPTSSRKSELSTDQPAMVTSQLPPSSGALLYLDSQENLRQTSSYHQRMQYQVPRHCLPRSQSPPPRSPPAQQQVFVIMEEIGPGYVFGLDDLDLPHCVKRKPRHLALVSEGAEVIMLSKKLLVDNADVNVQNHWQCLTMNYPDLKEVSENVQQGWAWEYYLQTLSDDFLQELTRRGNTIHGVYFPTSPLADSFMLSGIRTDTR